MAITIGFLSARIIFIPFFLANNGTSLRLLSRDSCGLNSFRRGTWQIGTDQLQWFKYQFITKTIRTTHE
jgi:hypothetical protein